MAINDIVQTIAEARVDARSLSEFVFKPAGFKVARRLAPPVDTLQFYINRFNSLNGDFSSSVSVALSSLNNSVAEADGKVAYIETTVQDAINNTAVEGGVLADTFVTVTANAAGSVPRTQRDVNSEYTSIETFGGNFAVAGAWLSQSSQHILNLKSGTTYNLQTSTTPVYFNRIVCRDGIAIVNILGTGQLTLANTTTGNNDRLYLEGLDVRWEGRRVGVLHEGAGFYPKHIIDPKIYVFKTATLKNLTFRALTNLSDVNSFSDTIGKTRGRLGLSYNVTEWSDVTDVKTYGVGFVAQIAPAAEGCYHREERITSYDVETIIYLPQLSFEWESGETHHIKGINTLAQQGYWYAGEETDLSKKQYINGKNCVMCEADHSILHNISYITAEYMIEKSLYAQSRNTKVHHIIDRGTVAPAAIKSTLTPKPNSKGFGSDVYFEGKSGVVECYGWNDIILDNHTIKSGLDTTGKQFQRWSFQASGSDNATLKNSEIHNTETAIYLTSANNLTVDNVKFYGVGGANYPSLVHVPTSYDETRKITVDYTSKTGVVKKVILNSRFPAHNEWVFDAASDREGVTFATVTGVITIAATAIDTTKPIVVNTFNPLGVSTINNPDTTPIITSQDAVIKSDLSVTVTHKPAFVSYSPNSVTLRNVTATYTPSTLSAGAYAVALLAPRANKILLDKVHGFPCSLLPFKIDANYANKVEIIDSSFDLVGQYTLTNNLTELFKIGTDFKASKFDFTVNVISNYVFGTAIPTKVYKVKYRKLSDTGLVPCRDYWHSINLSYNQATEGQIQSIYNLSALPPHSFKCVARYRDNYIEFYYNITTGVKTLVHAIGTDIVDMAVFVGNSGTTAAERGENKFNVYVIDGKLVLLLGYDRWQKPYTGVVEVEITKL